MAHDPNNTDCGWNMPAPAVKGCKCSCPGGPSMSHEEMERRLNAAGFFLRDDTEIRTGVEAFKGHEEAYSLHTNNPFRRYHVYAGRRDWAVTMAHSMIFPTSKEYEGWVGFEVEKKSGKPFKSGSKVATVKGVIEHPQRPGKPAFTFNEDDSYVSCDQCELSKT